ncbi:MAG: hypothetical protein ACI87O_002262 [Planctomycetota bacterium]|jgi:hypothetical protein
MAPRALYTLALGQDLADAADSGPRPPTNPLFMFTHLRASLLLLLLVSSVPTLAHAQEWNAPDGAALHWFGYSVVSDSGWQLAGAPYETGAGPRSGAAYVRHTQSGEVSKLQAADAHAGQRFGWSVDLHGETLVVGAPAGNFGQGGAGAAYVFHWAEGSWQQVARIDGLPGHSGDGFGTSVSVDGDRILVGAPWNRGAGPRAGAAFLFERFAGVWGLREEFRTAHTGPGDAFGFAVDLSAGRGAVGAFSDNAVLYNEGAVYVFDFTSEAIVLQARLLEGQPRPNTSFGRALCLNGDRLAVGATDDYATDSRSGSVTLFDRAGGYWEETQRLQAPDLALGNAFGYALDLSDSRLMVGAPAANGGQGAAYVFESFAGQWLFTVEPEIAGLQEGDFVGADVDIQTPDPMVGAMRDSSLGWNAGAVHRLQPAHWQAPEVVTFCGCDEGPQCGSSAGSEFGCLNGTGKGARIGIEGSTSVKKDDWVLRMENLPAGAFGFFWMGDASVRMPLFDGYRCVHGGLQGVVRWAPGRADRSGVLRTGPGLVGLALDQGATLAAGSAWCFQGVYRDPSSPCGTDVNLSDAMWVTLVP